jgi:hypothetical protein
MGNRDRLPNQPARRAIEHVFAEYFANWQIRLPEGAVQLEEAGIIRQAGWTIRYVFEHDAGGP